MLHGRADSILGAVQDADDAGDNVMLDQVDLHIPPDGACGISGTRMGVCLGEAPTGRALATGNQKPGAVADGNACPATSSITYPDGGGSASASRVLRIQGSRTVDPGDHGGKVRQVIVIYGAPTARVWECVRSSGRVLRTGQPVSSARNRTADPWLLHRGLLPLRQLAALAAGISVDSWQFAPPDSARTTANCAADACTRKRTAPPRALLPAATHPCQRRGPRAQTAVAVCRVVAGNCSTH